MNQTIVTFDNVEYLNFWNRSNKFRNAVIINDTAATSYALTENRTILELPI